MAINLCKKKEKKNMYTCVDKSVEVGEAESEPSLGSCYPEQHRLLDRWSGEPEKAPGWDPESPAPVFREPR